MIQPQNPIWLMVGHKRMRSDRAMFKRLLWTGPLTKRLDAIAKLLNR